MHTEAKMFLYSGKGWKPLVELIESKNNSKLSTEITIYPLYSDSFSLQDIDRDFVVVTVSKMAELVIAEFGYDKEVASGNGICFELKRQQRTPVYGDNENAKNLACT